MTEDYVGECDGGPWAGSAFASTRERVPVEPTPPRPKPAHSYYEWNEGRRRWAWVDPGERLDYISDRMLEEFRG